MMVRKKGSCLGNVFLLNVRLRKSSNITNFQIWLRIVKPLKPVTALSPYWELEDRAV